MEIGDWSATRELNGLYRQIRSLGLETHVAEMDAFGFTVIPQALSKATVERARNSILATAEKRVGRCLDPETEEEFGDLTGGKEVAGQHYLLFKDPVFEEIVLNEKPLALITYLLGQSCWLSSCYSHVKGPGKVGLLLHSDNGNGVPVSPMPPYSMTANVNYALTDYTRERGALAMVPGSHRHARQPVESERYLAGNQANPDAIPMEIQAGDAVVWHGNTWHGSFPRLVPGLRINLATYYCRQFMAVQEIYSRDVPEAVMARHGRDSRFAQLIGLNHFNGWQDDGPDLDSRMKMPAGRTWHS